MRIAAIAATLVIAFSGTSNAEEISDATRQVPPEVLASAKAALTSIQGRLPEGASASFLVKLKDNKKLELVCFGCPPNDDCCTK